MSLWDKIKNAGRSDEYDEYEDDYEREDEVAEEDEVPASRARSFRRRASSVDIEDDTPSENGSGRVMNVTTPTQLQVVLVKPTEFEDSIEWLISAGLVYKVNNVSKLEHPLSVYDKLEHFKLFLLDVGLIKYMSHTDTKAILLNEPFQFKGALTENYVLQQLKGKFEVDPRYYSDKNSELDFVMQIGSEIVPIEVKASEDKSAPSFKRYIASNHPKIAIRFSKRGLKKDGDILNVPLYLANKLDKLIEGI